MVIWEKKKKIKKIFFRWQVDFRKMTQMNVDHENHTIRNIKRVKSSDL